MSVEDPEARKVIEHIEENCKLLYFGWYERVEYKVTVPIHEAGCQSVGCECPRATESRARQDQRPGLLQQLQEFQKHKDVDRNPKAARGAPRVKKPKSHPELKGFFTLDEITCEAYMLLDRIYEEAGRDRLMLSSPLKHVLQGVPYQVGQFVESRPDLADQILRATDKWVRQARSALNIAVSDAMFGDTVCGNCGGGLAIAWDNDSDVRCVGKPSAPSCGHTYPMSEWVALYEGRS